MEQKKPLTPDQFLEMEQTVLYVMQQQDGLLSFNYMSWFPSELRGKVMPLTESPYSS